jgi:hypothetical protein
MMSNPIPIDFVLGSLKRDGNGATGLLAAHIYANSRGTKILALAMKYAYP